MLREKDVSKNEKNLIELQRTEGQRWNYSTSTENSCYSLGCHITTTTRRRARVKRCEPGGRGRQGVD